MKFSFNADFKKKLEAAKTTIKPAAKPKTSAELQPSYAASIAAKYIPSTRISYIEYVTQIECACCKSTMLVLEDVRLKTFGRIRGVEETSYEKLAAKPEKYDLPVEYLFRQQIVHNCPACGTFPASKAEFINSQMLGEIVYGKEEIASRREEANGSSEMLDSSVDV